MDRYPLLFGIRRKLWRQQLAENERVKSLFEELVNKAESENIPLASITGYEDIICAASKLGHINERFGKGETLLHWAASFEPAYGEVSSKVLVLLLLGADPNIQDVLGRTPLHWVVNHDCSDIAEDSDIQYDRRTTSFALKVVIQLLYNGASPDIVDIYGASPLCHAVWSKCTQIADLLREFTSKHIPSSPEFLFKEHESIKSVRCSKVDLWIKEKTSNAIENKSRLQRLLSSPGIGLLQHENEIEMQKEQVIALFKRISTNVAKEDPLLEFVPTLAGSMAEGTKCQKPDEQDIILRLVKFENVCVPEESEYAPYGVITLKFNGNDAEMKEYERYILDGYLNREEILYSLITKIEKEVSAISNWSHKDVMNLYPSHNTTVELKQAIQVGDIGNLTFIWHGNYYKQIKLSIDVVPAVIIKAWRPPNAITVDPIGKPVPNETFLIFRAFIENFEYDLEIYGDYKSDVKNPVLNQSELEILNGKDWDSGSDCESDNDDDGVKEQVNATSSYYSTFMLRSIREDIGFSVKKTKDILRKVDVFFRNISDGQVDNKRVINAEDDASEFFHIKKLRKSASFNKSLQQKQTEVEDEVEGRNDDPESLRQHTSLEGFEINDNNAEEPSSASDQPSELKGKLLQQNEYLEGLTSSDKDIKEKILHAGTSEMSNVPVQVNKIACEKDSSHTDTEKIASEYIEDENIDVNKSIDGELESNVTAVFEELFGPQMVSADYLITENSDADDESYAAESNEEVTDDEDSDEEPREDMGFKISFSKWENEAMTGFPKCIKVAYMLSKILVSYVPEIRTPLNRGVDAFLHDSEGYSSVKDIFSYLLKMALFAVVRKNQGHQYLLDALIQEDNGEVISVQPANFERYTEQIIYTRTGVVLNPYYNENKTVSTKTLSPTELMQVAFWVDQLFSEIEASTETGYLATYFDNKLNILERITNSGLQKGKPYPAMFFLRKHCKMIRSLVRIQDEQPMLG